jgi:ferritin-like metal-binding protein YciE
VKLFSANVQDLHSLYIHHLKKALDMERKIVKALPGLVEEVNDFELSGSLRIHMQQTKEHVAKVERLLLRHTGQAQTETCKVIDGLTTAAADTIKDVPEPSIRDIALIGAAQQVEHHEIAVYGTLRRWADILGLAEDAVVLESIEAEESHADEMLSGISERVNFEAAA